MLFGVTLTNTWNLRQSHAHESAHLQSLIPVSYLGIMDSRIAVFQHRHLQLASQGKAGWDKLEVQHAKILSLISAWFNHEEIFSFGPWSMSKTIQPEGVNK